MGKDSNNTGFDYFTVISARVFDFVWAVSSAVIAFYFRFATVEVSIHYQSLILMGAVLVSLCSSFFGVYASWRGRRKVGLIARIFLAWAIAVGILLALLVFSHQADYFSRMWLGTWILGGTLGSAVFRVVVYKALGNLRTRGINHKRVLVVGAGNSARSVIASLKHNAWIGFDIVQIVPVDAAELSDPYQGISVGGEISDISSMVEAKDIQEVWICLPLRKGEEVDRILYSLRHSTANIRYVPDLSDFRLLNHKVSDIAGIQVLDLSCSPLSGANQYIKSLEDRLLGFIIFVCISPMLLLIAIGVKLSSPGPILFKQYRHGIDGKPINVYKFRSMEVHEEVEGVVTQATVNDSRITRLGAFLRKTSLDELPQFFNVIQGKMSIVGPRPHALAHNEYYKEIVESYMKRHKVKPGITGWAQVNGLRGETDTIDKMQKRVEFDLFYIENWSLILDLKIIFLTVYKGFINKNAY
ncbi:MAG: undecaprenyl-phosphate glucose phosphotransferase [Pseudomonadales bacterium]|nr:undecaprenyl-phosphate glucose phosphotransferase [Pseudomonadales bacterium]